MSKESASRRKTSSKQKAKMTHDLAAEIRFRKIMGIKDEDLAKMYDITLSRVRAILDLRTWTS